MERDWLGRVKRIVTVREPEFSATDVEALTAFMAWKRSLGAHGIPMDEATDPKNRNKYRGHFEVDFAQAAVERRREQMRKQYPDDPGHGWVFTVES